MDAAAPIDPAAPAASLQAEGTRLIDVASSDLGASIPTCEGWRSADLLRHVAGVWEAFRAIVTAASTDPPDHESFAAAPEDDDALPGFAAERLAALVEALETTDPTQPCWVWTGETTAAAFGRRALHETTVHRVDAELGMGTPTPVDPAVAFDGVDELYSVLLASVRLATPADGLPSGSLHLHQTDGDGELMLQVHEGSISVSREHAKGDAALRATGEELLLAAWGRRDLAGLELFGDPAVAEEWLALSP